LPFKDIRKTKPFRHKDYK